MTNSKKVVIITGCSSGLGFFTVVRLIQAGYIVYATMRDARSRKMLMQACDSSSSLFIRQFDITQYSEITQFVSDVINEQGQIDVLINNAGSALLGPVDSARIEEVESLFQVNVFSILKLTQLVIPNMRKRKEGQIINIGSPCGIESSPFLGIYAATKQALEAITINWASTLYKWNIRVSIIQPGAMRNTNLFDSMKVGSYYDDLKEDPYHQFNQKAQILLQKCSKNGLNPEDVAVLILAIINDPHPHLCYQPCDYSKGLAKKDWLDPTKNQCVQRHRNLVDNWFGNKVINLNES